MQSSQQARKCKSSLAQHQVGVSAWHESTPVLHSVELVILHRSARADPCLAAPAMLPPSGVVAT
jgi:hypothetical protein